MRYAKLSPHRIKKIIRCFCIDIDASKTAKLLGFNRKTANRYFLLFRHAIYRFQTEQLRLFVGKVELDESYFGGKRRRGVPGKRGRGTSKQPVFGIFERGGSVFTEIIPDCRKQTLQEVITGKVSPDAVVISDEWRGYDGLVDVGYDRHYRITHSKHFSKNGVHINGIESFWSFTKRRLAKFNGVKVNFPLHLKECEWRWNKETKTLEHELAKILKSHQ
ncbi:MAG: IS1595 family transposase [Candidatus Peribacteraceae bacterium]|nr:IS1595 family transposase [Candidatus Peribacteraceae bacterium]